MWKVRLSSVSYKAHLWQDFVIDNILYSGKLTLHEADGLLALVDPTEELLTFKGPKLWYTYEPSWHYHYRGHPIGKRLVKTLDRSEWAYFANPEVKYRVPHSVYMDCLSCPRQDKQLEYCVAVVSNYGGRIWFLRRHIWLRNLIILHPKVHLYGRSENWQKFRWFPQLWKVAFPRNYKGPLETNNSEDFIKYLSSYKVCVCLENSCEELYFTEKFVNAVRAGCIPIYHAHPSVKEKYLTGAKWVDPADHGFSAKRTIEYALSQNIQEYRQANDVWLKSGKIDKLDHGKVIPLWLHPILKEKFDALECNKQK